MHAHLLGDDEEKNLKKHDEREVDHELGLDPLDAALVVLRIVHHVRTAPRRVWVEATVLHRFIVFNTYNEIREFADVPFVKINGPFPVSFSSFRFFIIQTVNKYSLCKLLMDVSGPPVLEATALPTTLPTRPQPLSYVSLVESNPSCLG